LQYLYIKKSKKLGAILQKGNNDLSIKIKELPETERPYEKLELKGEKNLSNAELLAIIIKTGTREETSVQLAQRILNLNDNITNDLNYLQSLTLQELMQIKGIGRVKAIQIKAVCEFSIRMFKTNDYKKVIIKNPHDIAKIFMSELKFEKREKLKQIILNNKNEVIQIKEIATGSTNFVNVPIKDILYEPVKMGANKFIIIHNHPSGDSTPSKEDIIFTNKLYDYATLMGIELVDHVVIGNMNYTSIFDVILNKKHNNK
jgi:DNA repair protein RadC